MSLQIIKNILNYKKKLLKFNYLKIIFIVSNYEIEDQGKVTTVCIFIVITCIKFLFVWEEDCV